MDVRRPPITQGSKLSTSHVRRRQWPLTLVDFSVIENRIRAICKRRRACGSACTKERGGVVSDPSVRYPEPPVALVEKILDLQPVLNSAVSAEGCKDCSREDCAVKLHPATHILIPASNLVSLGRITIGSIVGEEMWCGDLVRVVDPIWQCQQRCLLVKVERTAPMKCFESASFRLKIVKQGNSRTSLPRLSGHLGSSRAK